MRPLVVTFGLVLALGGCGAKGDGAPPQAVPEVTVTTVASGPVMASEELPGRVSPLRLAEVRARVAGIVLRRAFQEGAEIGRGEVLYVIDPVGSPGTELEFAL